MNLTINFSAKNKNIKEKVENSFQWYDIILKKMNTYKGGKLEYKYQKDEELEKLGYDNPYRILPEVAELEKTISKSVSNKEEVIKWFKSYMRNSNIEIISFGSNGIEINVPEKEVDDFKYQLDRNRFDYS